MPVQIDWREIALRLLCTVLAGAVIGFNREGRGHTAGLRTTILLCLSASLAMILANLMIDTTGKTQTSFVQLDMMRLPLGILTGMGFIGAGAILRRDNLVVGVTTAATLWFVTVMGLCFGAGHFGLGFAALGIGFVTLVGLKWLERHLELERNAMLTIVVGQNKTTENEIAKPFVDAGYKIKFSSVTYDSFGKIMQVDGNVRWRGQIGESCPPEFLKQLAERHHFEKLEWRVVGSGA
jgi:putative Mg2+ transporter-C (MgtC) family protein